MMTAKHSARVDFHLHSYASNVTDYYAANTLSIPESYSDPLETYRTLKAKGLDLVTLTDHNSIDGVLELLEAGYDDVFISSEMTTTFPEDGCNIHVTVANMTEGQFAEVDRLRGNVYEMLAYVEEQIALEALTPDGNRLAYFMTHPLMSTQNREYGRRGSLTVEHIEKALLILPCFEVHNGTRTRQLNGLTDHLLDSLDETTIERLANKHNLEPVGSTPWHKARVGGSDDHSGINPGQTWTRFPYDGAKPTPNMLVDAIRARKTRAEGAHGGPITLAHAVFKLLHDGQRKGNAASEGHGRAVTMGGPMDSLLGFAFDTGPTRWHSKIKQGIGLARARVGSVIAKRRNSERSFEEILTAEAYDLIASPEFQRAVASVEDTDQKIFTVISRLLNRVFVNYMERIRRSGPVNLVRTVKELVALVTSNLFVSLPYFMSYVAQSSDKMVCRDVRKNFNLHERERLLLVTDTLFDVNGVAKTIWKVLDEAKARGIDLTVVTCTSKEELEQRSAAPEVQRLIAEGRLRILPSVYSMAFPEYEGLQVHFPPLLDFLKFAQEEGFTRMQISTPGTVGIAGLIAAKLLQIESSATYHTSFPEYVENYTRDISLEAITWKYMVLFYHSVDEVVVPSKFIAKLLHSRGLRKRKLLILDRWVDSERFRPTLRVPEFWTRYGVENEGEKVKFAYVGRLGVEKNLDTLARAFRKVHSQYPSAHLMLIGDGPYRSDLEAALEGLPVTFTGFLGGEDLARAMASVDAKVFPSMTDTWGNAPLEAQASGVPVIVSDQGGPQELMVPDVTGFRVQGLDTDRLADAMIRLMDDDLRLAMGRAARAFVERNRIDHPFSAILDPDGYREQARRKSPRPVSLEDAPTVVVTPHCEELVSGVDETADDPVVPVLSTVEAR